MTKEQLIRIKDSVIDFVTYYWQPLLIVVCFIVSAIAIIAGFGEGRATVTSCHVTYQAEVTAHYSERYLTTCTTTDSNGNLRTTPCHQTRHWSKPASLVWTAQTINGELIANVTDETKVYKGNHGYYMVDVPPRDESLSKHYNFDYFRTSRTSKLKIVVDFNQERREFGDSPSVYKSCESSRENFIPITVKTWYGNPYKINVAL